MLLAHSWHVKIYSTIQFSCHHIYISGTSDSLPRPKMAPIFSSVFKVRKEIPDVRVKHL